MVLKTILGHFNTFITMYILDKCRCMGTFYGRVELDEGIFLVSVGELTFFMGGWG